jgi:hypothetical protein
MLGLCYVINWLGKESIMSGFVSKYLQKLKA